MDLKDTSLLEILSDTLIKPSSITPPSSRCYKLSHKDQMARSDYVPCAYFYPADNTGGKDRSSSTDEISQLLQTSLSKTLTYYYPFAGRLMDNCFVNCNDAGVQFTEARIKCSMSQILKPENSFLKDLVFPRCHFASDVSLTEYSLLIIQVSYFDCGGMALGLWSSHKVLDGITACNFINDWAAMARKLCDHVPTPLFNGASLFPPVEDDESLMNDLKASPPIGNCITRRFLFQSSKIDELKAMAANSSGVDNPTRLEVVTALLYMCAMAASKANSGSFQQSILFNAANLRSLTVPPLPQHSVGNFVTFFPVSATMESHMNFADLVRQFRKEKLKLQNEYKGNKGAKDDISSASCAKVEEVESERFDQYYFCSSWYRFPFYDVDYGLGKPALVCNINQTGAKNTFFLAGTKDGDAIEAIVTLDASEMSFFQRNKELLAFASLNA